jgi:twitching motility protein PilT
MPGMNPNLESAVDMEKRADSRFKSVIKINLRSAGNDESPWRSVIAKDISSTGASYVSNEFIPLNTRLELVIMIPNVDEEIRTDAIVKRVSDLGVKGFSYGLHFENMEQRHSDIIQKRINTIDIKKMLRDALDMDASDLHLCVNNPPVIRIGGRIKKLNHPSLEKEILEDMIFNAITPDQAERLIQNLELNSSYSLSEKERFRVNVHFQKGHMEATFRRIHTEQKTLDELGLPEIVKKLTLSDSGFIVITGVTNNGKSTTASSMIELINQVKEVVIMTIEDPIESIYTNKKSIVKQREVGTDTKSFSVATQHSLRQDCNVIFIGEVLDPDTLLVALRAAEVGHLVITTFPARDTMQAVERMVYAMPSNLQQQVRMQLSNTLLCIIAQKLYPRKDERDKLALATELLINTPAVSNSIREGNFTNIKNCLQTGLSQGMHTLEGSVKILCQKGIIDEACLVELASGK